MKKKLLVFIYYILIKKIPNSRFCKICNRLRVFYLTYILPIIIKSENCFFEENIYIGNGENITIGKECQINENVFIQGATIGDYVMIAANVSILANMHKFDRVDIPMSLQGKDIGNKVTIEDDVWIGRNAMILPGITIKKGAIVAAGAVVTKDIEEYSIVGGIPARLIKKRKSDVRNNRKSK